MHRAIHCSALVLAVALAGCETVSKETLQEIDYGPRPASWRKQILDYLGPKVPDAKTVEISFPLPPKAHYQRETLLRDRHWGWAVCVHVFDNHPEGAEDPYAVVFFFRGEKMTFVNGGPGDRNPIGSGYARVQCGDLGAPALTEGKAAPKRQAAPAAPAQPQSPYPK